MNEVIMDLYKKAEPVVLDSRHPGPKVKRPEFVSTREELIRSIHIGSRVVHRASGCTGEVREVIAGWGVEVWVLDHNNARERWWWDALTIRIPRKVKRYPRPFRFARLKPTRICHCKVGKMVVSGEKKDKVRCTKCKFFIGFESFPNRIRRANSMLRKAALLMAERKRRARKKVVRPKRKATRPRKSRPSKTPPRKGRVGVRSGGRKEEKHGDSQTQVQAVAPEPATVPQSPPIPEVESPAVPTPEEVKKVDEGTNV